MIEYGERLPSPEVDKAVSAAVSSTDDDETHLRPHDEGRRGAGYCFMDSPGNDLESIAGQVASGCNVIYFSTGNGSITNFPFVPTIKVTHRYVTHDSLAPPSPTC